MKKLYTIIAMLICLGVQAQKVEWVKSLGFGANDQGLRCKADNNGNLLFAGTFTDSIEFGNIKLIGKGGTDGYIAKTDNSGNIIWAKAITTPRKGKSADARGIAVDADNNVFIAGTFSDTVYIGGQLFEGVKETPISKDIYLAKFNSNGTFVWAKIFTGTKSDIAEDIEILGSILVMGGSYSGNLTIGTLFQSQDTNNPGNNPFVAAFNLNGDPLWIDKIDCESGFCRGLTISPDGKINILIEAKGSPYVRTVSSSYVSSLKQSTNSTVDDYVVQLNQTDGSVIWSNQMGSDGPEMGYAITSDASSNIYISGFFKNTIKLNSTTSGTYKTGTSKGDFDVFICKYNSTGELQWANFIGDTEREGTRDIAVTSGGYVYIAGYFLTKTTVGGNVFTSSNLDSYIAKLDPDGNIKWAQAAASSKGTSHFTSICITPTDSIAVTGYYRGNGTFIDNTALANPHDSTNVWIGLINHMSHAAGIFTEKNNIKLSIFPVPANDQINIRVDSDQRIERTRIFDIIGNTLYDNSSERYTIPVSNYHNGVYLIEVTTNKGRSVQRVIINR